MSDIVKPREHSEKAYDSAEQKQHGTASSVANGDFENSNGDKRRAEDISKKRYLYDA
jgi:hypothetical protein